MATITLLEKARQRRLNALASLGQSSESHSHYENNIVSIFDYAFDEAAAETRLAAKNNVVAFRSARQNPVAANDATAPDATIAA